ncbi:MAG: nuclear transport factor 2 family protein [Algoriphagus sp.]|uniref:YybH family protein n=1 Tax=Algoriphagus sp. TaxID=1872435 RepID=UPI002603BF1C|nr:nuclear transport factor 2 family protein [Algoriphagus sp.]MDG1276147.1 nuclear transport factor 2 family protein [Algoriphagus sp.]
MKLAFCCFFYFVVGFAMAQDSDSTQILAQRKASNAALRQFDEDLNATFSTEDAFITTGAGTLLAGKKALQDYIQNASGPNMYWIRTPSEIKVNPETKLAWETGTWEGFYEDSKEPVVGGNYSAMWTKASGVWLIKSQLFVTLPIE